MVVANARATGGDKTIGQITIPTPLQLKILRAPTTEEDVLKK